MAESGLEASLLRSSSRTPRSLSAEEVLEEAERSVPQWHSCVYGVMMVLPMVLFLVFGLVFLYDKVLGSLVELGMLPASVQIFNDYVPPPCNSTGEDDKWTTGPLYVLSGQLLAWGAYDIDTSGPDCNNVLYTPLQISPWIWFLWFVYLRIIICTFELRTLSTGTSNKFWCSCFTRGSPNVLRMLVRRVYVTKLDASACNDACNKLSEDITSTCKYEDAEDIRDRISSGYLTKVDPRCLQVNESSSRSRRIVIHASG